MVTRVANHRELVLLSTFHRRDVTRVDPDKVLRVANAGPAAVVHETLDMLAIALNAGEAQKVSGQGQGVRK